ncbi:MAG: tRNA1(Val) (adenine(37)-N6)-methyltransferase, partial [Hyphomonadaceae bacterium]
MGNDADVTEDRLLDGRIVIRQPARGYRVNADTLLLAAAIETADGPILEAGCGVGAGLIALASRDPAAQLIGVERDAGYARLARENVALNGCAARVRVETGDALAAEGIFAGIYFNPPYDQTGEGRAPAEARRSAYIAEESLETWIKALSNKLAGGGAMTLIHRARKLGDILAALEGRLGGVEILPIRPRAKEAAKRVLVRARKGSRAPLKLY